MARFGVSLTTKKRLALNAWLQWSILIYKKSLGRLETPAPWSICAHARREPAVW